MKEKIIDIYKKTLDFAKSNRYVTIGIAVAIVVLIAVIVIISVSGNGTDATNGDWGDGLTEKIPRFDGNCTNSVITDSFCAAYYTDVTGDAVEEYIDKIESECNVKFEGERYPRSATYGEKIIAVHYNVTEKKFSVTVVLKNEQYTISE